MFDDVRLHSQGRTFIFPRWLRWGGKPRPSLPQGRALKKSPFFMTKTENAYDL